MKYRILTVAREYGSGGAEIAALVARQLGWRLLDRNLIYRIARMAGVDVDVARARDEHVDSWLHRMTKPLWYGDLQAVATITPADMFDAESMVRLTRDVIQEAAAAGDCVIVGRGGQCILQDRDDAFHAFVYAPWAERVHRIRQRLLTEDGVEALVREVDSERAGYVRLYFSCDWADPHLYDLMISSRPGCEAVAALIVQALRELG